MVFWCFFNVVVFFIIFRMLFWIWKVRLMFFVYLLSIGRVWCFLFLVFNVLRWMVVWINVLVLWWWICLSVFRGMCLFFVFKFSVWLLYILVILLVFVSLEIIEILLWFDIFGILVLFRIENVSVCKVLLVRIVFVLLNFIW